MNNTTDIFFNNGQLDWNALSTITNTILVLALVIITWWYAREVKKQTEFMKMDRAVEEMEKLVAPLDSKIEDLYHPIFMNGTPLYGDQYHEYHMFWNGIRQAKYLGPDYLRSAIDNYLRNKSDEFVDDGDDTRDPSYEKAEDELFKAIKKRYSELENELLISGKGAKS
ncbi:MAG TPA: hypothetical protein ENG16_04160 [Archaeoglobus sp.]|nr:hypothetical protein [Candidatus Neomarinimicrobiota bacterium]HDN74199.1 hypothetical protein [Archaeoglobus sp.]